MDDTEIELHIVTDFILGPTLQQWRESRKQVELNDAIAVTRELLVVLNTCHVADLVHRNVKPDNIILADGNPERPVLLDFGLSFRKVSEIDFETEAGQEIGNRFLRLPELASGNSQKRDARSDLSFAGGILFYLLTGQPPYILEDSDRRLPHQRDKPLAVFQDVVNAERLPRLLSWFDKAFTPSFADRFGSADAMLTSMERVMEPRDEPHSEESRLQDIREAMDTDSPRVRNGDRRVFRWRAAPTRHDIESFGEVQIHHSSMAAMSLSDQPKW